MLASAHNGATPLVDRLEEQTLLTSLLDDVATRGQALGLHGEPGIGKPRLLAKRAPPAWLFRSHFTRGATEAAGYDTPAPVSSLCAGVRRRVAGSVRPSMTASGTLCVSRAVATATAAIRLDTST